MHLREHPANDLPKLVALLDRFIDGNLRYPLEWDDFISWNHDAPSIEAIRARIAEMEPLFFSRAPADRARAVELLIGERNRAAAVLGLPPREGGVVHGRGSSEHGA